MSVAEYRRIVTADLKDGPAIQIEVRDDPEREVSIGKVFDFEPMVASIEAITKSVARAVEAVRPNRTSLEFGLDVGVESGGLTALIVKGTGSATLKITLEWERQAADSGT